MMFPRRGNFLHSDIDDWEVLALWDNGFDTVGISRMMQTSEAQVHNRLLHLRDYRYRSKQQLPKATQP